MASHIRTSKGWQLWIISICLIGLMSTIKTTDSLKIPNLLSAAFGVGSPSSTVKNQQQQSQLAPSTSSAAVVGMNQQQTHGSQLFQTPLTQQAGSGRFIAKPFQSLLPSRHHALLFNSLPKSLFGRLTASSSSPTQSSTGSSARTPLQLPVYNLPLLMHYHKKMKSLGLGGKSPQPFSPLAANADQTRKIPHGQQGIDMDDYVDLAALLQQQQQLAIKPTGSRYPYGPDGSSNSNANSKAHSVPHHLIAMNSVPVAQQLNAIRQSPQTQQQKQPQMFLSSLNNQDGNQLKQQSQLQSVNNHPRVIKQQQQQPSIGGNGKQQLLANGNSKDSDSKTIEDIGMLVDEELRKLELNVTNNHQHKELFPDLFINGTILKTAIENSIAEENLNRNISILSPADHHRIVNPAKQTKQLAQPTKSVNVTELVSVATNQQQLMNSNVKKTVNIEQAAINAAQNNATTPPIKSSAEVSGSAISGVVGQDKISEQATAKHIDTNVFHKEIVSVDPGDAVRAVAAPAQHQHHHENMETSATASNVARMNAIAAGLDDTKIEKFILGPYKGPHVTADQQQQHLSFPMSLLNVNYPNRPAQHSLVEQKAFDKTLLAASTNNYNHFYSYQQQQPALSHIFYPPQHASSNMDFMLDLNNNGNNIPTKQQGTKSSHQAQQQQHLQPQLYQQQDQKLYSNSNRNNNNDNSDRINQLDHHRHHQHQHQMMRETNPTAIVDLANPVHMLYQQQQARTGGGQSTHQHHQLQHQQMLTPKGNNEALVNMHRQYNNQAQRQQRQPLASPHHHHHQQQQQQQQQHKFVDSSYRLETNNNNNNNNKYSTDADNNKLPNNVVNNQKMFHGHYQHQPTQHITMANGAPAFFDASTGTLIDFGTQADDSDNQPDLSDNSINAFIQQQQQQQQAATVNGQMEQTGNSRYAVPMNHMGQPQQTTTFTQYTVPLLHHTQQQKQTQQQQQQQQQQPSDTSGYYSTIVISHNVPGNDQQSSKFKSGLYQIDPPKLINGSSAGNYEQQQAQTSPQNGFESGGYGLTQSNNVGDINSSNDTRQTALISEPERVNYQLQDSQAISQEEIQKEENGQNYQNDQHGLNENVPQSQAHNNFTFVKQVEATIGVEQQQNKLRQQSDDSLSSPVKGKVFNEPLFSNQQQQQNDQDQAGIDSGNQIIRPQSNDYQGDGTKGANGRVRHPSPLTSGKKAEEYKILRQQQQQLHFPSTPGYEQQQAILSTTTAISPEASTTAQNDAIDANNQQQQQQYAYEQQIKNTKQQPLLETEVYTIPYTIHHHQKPDQNGFISRNQANQVENIFNGGQHGKPNQPINHFQTSQDSSLRQYPAFSPSLLSTIYHSRQQQQQMGPNNYNRLNDQQAQHTFDQQQSFMKTILSNDYNQQRLPQTLVEWKPPTVPFLTYGENNPQQQQQTIEFVSDNNQGHPTTINNNNNLYSQTPEQQHQQQQANFVRQPIAQQESISSGHQNIPQQQQFLFAIHHNQLGTQQQKHDTIPSTTVPTATTSTTTTVQSLPTTTQQLSETISNGYDPTIGPPAANLADLWNNASPRPSTGPVQQYQQHPISALPNQQQQQAFEQSAPIIEPDGQNIEDINRQQLSDQQQPLKQATFDVQAQKQESDSFHNGGQESQQNSEPIFNQFNTNTRNNNENKGAQSNDDDDDQSTTQQQQQQLDLNRPSSLDSGLHRDIQHQDIQRATQQQRQQYVEAMDSQVQAPPSPFFCANRSPGLYADESQKCKVYYQCGPTGQQQFKCGNQTQFNQKTLTCDWWYNVDCSSNQSQQQMEALSGPSEDHFGISDQSHQKTKLSNAGEQPSFSRQSTEQQTQDANSQQQDEDQTRKSEFDAAISQGNNREQQQRDSDSDSQSSSNRQVSFASSGQQQKQSKGWDALNSFLTGNSNDNSDDHQQHHEHPQVQQQYQEEVKSAPYENKQQDYSASLRPEVFHHSESQSNTTVSTIQPLPQMIGVPPSSPASQPLYYVTSIPSTWSSNTNVIHHQPSSYHKPDSMTTVQSTEPSISLNPTIPSNPQVGAILSDEGVVSSSSTPNSNSVGGQIENRSGQQQPNQVSASSAQQQQQNSARFSVNSNVANQDQQQLLSLTPPAEPLSQLPVNNQDGVQAKLDNGIVQQQQLNGGATRTDVKQSDRQKNEDSPSPSSTIQSDNNSGSATEKQRPQEDNDFAGAKSRRLANQRDDQQQTVISTKSDDTRPLSVVFDSARTSAATPVTATNSDQQQRQPTAHRYTPTRLSANSNDRSQQQISQSEHTYSGGSFVTNGGGESVYSTGNNQGSVSYTPTDVHYLTAKGLVATVDQNDSSSPKLLSKASANEQNNVGSIESSSSQSNQEQASSRSNSSSSSNNKLDRRYGQRLSVKTVNATVAQKKSSA